MTTLDRLQRELAEVRERLRRREDLSEEELDQALTRLALLREQIDQVRKEMEGARLLELQGLQDIQAQIDTERTG